MSNACEKREFKLGQTVYLVDYWGTVDGSQAFETSAKILYVDENNATFDAILYGDTYQKYSFKDYGRLIFDTSNDAATAASKLPKPNSIVYQIIGKRIYKKTALGIGGRYVNGVYDLIVYLKNGKYISTKEIDSTVFLNKLDAIKKRNSP